MNNERKNSKKRQAILDALQNTVEHPNAEMLYRQLKDSIPSLSLATVYRNLNMLADDGMIVSVGEVNGQERFDGRTDEHAHFVCRKCFRVFDIALPEALADSCAASAGEQGFAVESRTVRLNGLCPRCREQSGDEQVY